MASPFFSLDEPHVLFALPLHGVEQEHTQRRHNAAATRRKRPKSRRRAFARHDRRGTKTTQKNQRSQRDAAVRAAAQGVEVQDALAAGFHRQELVAQVGLVVGQVAGQRDLQRPFAFAHRMPCSWQ